MVKGVRTSDGIRKLADVVQEVMLEKFNTPARDGYVSHTFRTFTLLMGARYQIITQHEPFEIICEDINSASNATDKLFFIQIFQQGRNAKLKQAITPSCRSSWRKIALFQGRI